MIYAVTYGGPTDAMTVAGVRIPRGETREVDISERLYEQLATTPAHTIDLTPTSGGEPDIPDPETAPGSTEEDMTDAAP